MTLVRQRDRLPLNMRELKFEDILTKVITIYLYYFKDQLQLIKATNY